MANKKTNTTSADDAEDESSDEENNIELGEWSTLVDRIPKLLLHYLNK